MFFIILHLLQYFLEDFFVPLRRIALFVEEVCELAGKFIFEIIVVQPVGIDGSVVDQNFDFLCQFDAAIIRILDQM